LGKVCTKNNGSKIHKHDYIVFGNDNNTELQKSKQFNKIGKKHGMALLHHSKNNLLSA
jgi:hypothetical protein